MEYEVVEWLSQFLELITYNANPKGSVAILINRLYDTIIPIWM